MIRRLLVPFIIFFIITIIIVNVYLWRSYELIQKELDSALGVRLKSIATAVAAGIDNLKDLDEQKVYFNQVVHSTGLYNLYIIDSEEDVLYNYRKKFYEKGVEPHLRLDQEQILIGLSGEASATPLYKEAGVYLKSGYAPILDVYGGVIGVVGVVADAPFFSLLVEFENRGLLLNIILIISLIVISVGFIIILRRISRIEEKIATANAFLLLGQLAATVAHEIKNPLSIISAAAERVKKRLGDDTNLEYIRDETKRIDQIIRGYLSLGSRDLRVEADINRIIKEVIEGLRPKFADKRIDIELELDEKGMVTTTNPGQMRQVMINLLLNGYEAIEDSGRIRIITRREDGELMITVSDTGAGIDRKDQKRIFSPFYTTKRTGSGIGLFVVKRTIEDLGGEIKLTKEKGYNTSFIIRFKR
ncbi:MAG TPA: GHKL domain-containing protein [bacterium (Candidatus Stahlbacteria)]|nr:GHKL domain-containing protein [Candidatus Stahlbacteria bacterium]